MNNNEEFYTIGLAALLHDIGKFWQRAGELTFWKMYN